MKNLCISLPIIWGFWCAQSSALEIKFPEYEKCLKEVNTIQRAAHEKIPTLFMRIDLEIVTYEERIEAALQNLTYLRLLHENKQLNDKSAYLVGNAIVKCENLKKNYQSRAQSLWRVVFWIYALSGATVIAILFSILLPSRPRPVKVETPKVEDKDKPSSGAI